MTHPSGIPLFERFFRSVARIKVDKNDVRRFVIVPQDLPITKGVQERMREFDKLDEARDIRNRLSQVVRRPPADVTFDEDTEQMLPELFGGLRIALARSFRV